MHQAALIGEYAHDSTDYGWAQLQQGFLFQYLVLEKKKSNEFVY